MVKIFQKSIFRDEEFDTEFFIRDKDDPDEIRHERVFRILQNARVLRRLERWGWCEFCDNTFSPVKHWGGNIITGWFIYKQLKPDFVVKHGNDYVWFTSRLLDGCNVPFVCMGRGSTPREALKNLEDNVPLFI